jgi:hypothetical protein
MGKMGEMGEVGKWWMDGSVGADPRVCPAMEALDRFLPQSRFELVLIPQVAVEAGSLH